MLTAEQLKQRLKGRILSSLMESPYYASLKGDAIDQFEKLLPQLKQDKFELDNVRPLVMADMSFEIESMMKNSAQSDSVDRAEVLKRTTAAVDRLYESFK
jgi:hypothetical protein